MQCCSPGSERTSQIKQTRERHSEGHQRWPEIWNNFCTRNRKGNNTLQPGTEIKREGIGWSHGKAAGAGEDLREQFNTVSQHEETKGALSSGQVGGFKAAK